MAAGTSRPRPLDLLRSIKVKLGVVVVVSVVATVGAIFVSLRFGLQPRYAFVLGLAVSLIVIQLLAHGMVLPLREMATASEAMAGGDYQQRVTSTAQDEVGTLARSFNEMAAKLDEVERQRRELVANVSHELRTPIATLRARLENLADGVEALDQDAVGAMLKATGRLSALVDQLLELAQFESGGTPLDKSRFALDALIRDAVGEVAPVDPDVHLVVATETDLHVNGDRARLHQVLTNLLTNAVRHSPAQGRVEVGVSTRATGVHIEVADQGPGIPTEELERVFERFYRVDAARASSAGGAGLGLAIARSIIELHGGSIHATSNEPHGCRMVIDLPG